MKHILLTTALMSAWAAAASAQVTPKVLPEVPVDGQKYVLVNMAQTANQYTTRTSWDGALYFLGKDDSNYENYALTAHDNGDGTWSFSMQTLADDSEDPDALGSYLKTEYMYLPAGSANINMSETPAKWGLVPTVNGYYNLVMGAGNNPSAMDMAQFTPTKDLRMHLNAGSQYFCITYFEGPWYPDVLGGINEIEDDMTGNVYFEAADSVSFNWGFVSLDKVDAFYEDFAVSGVINNYYAKYGNDEEYGTGFKATADAAAAIYKSEEFNEEDIEIINEMLNAKVALREEIEKAIGINVQEDKVFGTAIANAKKAFDTLTSTAEVKAAIETLKAAELAYQEQSGEMTAMGQNMSFEDLSSQGGNTTSGVAGAPTGWNVYINNIKAVTADDVKAGGIANWHGINADCSGEIKDGSMGFGLWVNAVPEYEISQTIEGLENGTYEIIAGLMAGSNGNGSRLTSQRIFGNLNSTYYGSQSDYDESHLDQSELYAFAGNEILTTDTEMRPVTVRAFVYDGTLTFGVRTNGNVACAGRTISNQAGGDGWFKTDNFRIMKKGYIAADALAVYNHFAETLKNIAIEGIPMSAAMAKTLEEGVAKLPELTEDSPVEDIAAGINQARELAAKVNVSVEAYQKLRDAIDEHWNNADKYSTKRGADDYIDFIQEVQDAYDDGAVADDEVDNVIQQLNDALEECIKSDEIEEGQDITEYIKNHGFEDLSAQGNSSTSGVVAPPAGWNLYLNGEKCETVSDINAQGVTGWCGINGGDAISVELEDGTIATHQYTEGEHLWGIWNDVIPEVELSQVITNLPAGTYTVSADVLVEYQWAGYCLTTQRIFANDYVALYSYEGNYSGNMPDDAKIAMEIDSIAGDVDVPHLIYAGWECAAPRSTYSYPVKLTFGLAEAGDIKIGFRTNNIDRDGVEQNQGRGWFKIDNWQLTYDSVDVPAGAEVTAEATAVNTIATGKVATEFYSINGVRLAAPQRGINIVRMSNGTVQKVMVK